MAYGEHDLAPRLIVTDKEMSTVSTKNDLIKTLAGMAMGMGDIEIWLSAIGPRPGVKWLGVRKAGPIPLTLGRHPEVGAELIWKGKSGRRKR